MDRARPYQEQILLHAPRILGLIDREAMSPTSGCCDRTFWAWKFVDFPRSRFQEALCVLSFGGTVPFAGLISGQVIEVTTLRTVMYGGVVAAIALAVLIRLPEGDSVGEEILTDPA